MARVQAGVLDLDEAVVDGEGVVGVPPPLRKDLAQQQLQLHGADAHLALRCLHRGDRLQHPGGPSRLKRFRA